LATAKERALTAAEAELWLLMSAVLPPPETVDATVLPCSGGTAWVPAEGAPRPVVLAFEPTVTWNDPSVLMKRICSVPELLSFTARTCRRVALLDCCNRELI